jgi:NAD(P)-dependent dehydrogenase (short-subunit alcohol dehydrogenase family)
VELGGQALALPADVADATTVFAAADETVRRFGVIDLWINNAMVTIFSSFAKLTPEEFRRVTEVTYLGQVHGTMAALRHMRARNHGTIVQVGSALSYRAIPLQSAYCGAKFAVRGFTDSLRSELAHDRGAIKITIVQLPAVNTPQFDWARSRLPRRPRPVPPIFTPESVASEIVGAALNPKREHWVGRRSIEAILGTMAFPGLLDHLLARTGYSGQLSGEPDGAQEGNLFAPVPNSLAAQGRFEEEARSHPLSITSNMVRIGLASALVAVLLGAFAAGRLTTGPGRRRLSPH